MIKNSVFLAYGLVFLSVAIVLGVQAMSRPSHLVPRRSMLLLALATAANGANEWLMMALDAGTLPTGFVPVDANRFIGSALMTVTFAAFGQFGVETLRHHRRAPEQARYAPAVAVIAVWTLLFLSGAPFRPDRTMYAIIRYVLGITGTVTAAYALAVVSSLVHPGEGQEGVQRYLRRAAIALGFYTVLAGVVVSACPLFPSAFVNDQSFARLTHVDVDVARAACAVALGWCLVMALVVESAREHASWEQLREEFIAIIAHDLRNPVGAISLTAELLPNATVEESTRRNRILRNTRMLTRLVDDLLDASRIECHHVELHRRATDLGAVVRACVEQCNLEASHELRMEINELPIADVDPDRITQILVNLLSNAGKYSPCGTPVIVKAEAREGWVTIGVTSVGYIALAERERLFSRFYRTSSARTSKAHGMGLGLYITRGLVEAHGGHIWVDSRPPPEAQVTFCVSLPCAAPTPVEEGAQPRLVA